MSKLKENDLRYQLNNAIDNVITERRIINKLHNKRHHYPKIPEFVKLIILPKDLFDPLNKKKSDIRGTSVIRKLYKSFDVACIPITIPTEKYSMRANSIIQQIEIMIKLNSSRNFLKYFGISNTINTLIMINEWAELGNLKEVYNNYNISWNVKIQISLDICRGICFMHENDILHHNLQCANIMMSGYCEPKITNFEYSYYMGDNPSMSPTIDKVINWTAPEKIENFDTYKYDIKCEVFSFGMLLWELVFERIPYQDWDTQKIKDHVLNNNRENIDSMNNENYFEIIKNAWNQNPKDRDQFTIVFNKLEQLAFSYYKNGISLNLTSKFTHRITTKPTNELEARAKLWIEDMIEKKVIKSIEWSEFKSDSVEEIGKGNFGSIIKAYWENGHNYIVCKKLVNSSDIQYKEWEAFKHELHMQSRAHSCENIIRILGISKNDKYEYHIVMEYADEGDLKHYLSKRFKELDWKKKFRLALDITNGLYFLHKEKILHRDLHAKNIVIHQGKAKITDFGYCKSMNTAIIIHEKLFGNIRYVAPEILRVSKTKHYPYTEYSDTYSLGVLLWEISSGQNPFEDQSDYTVIAAILSGYREERIKDTPDEYYELYSKCWNDEPKKRCTIDYVYNALKKLLEKYDNKENNDKKEVDDKKEIDKDDSLCLDSQEFSSNQPVN